MKTSHGMEFWGRWTRVALVFAISSALAGLALGFAAIPASVEDVAGKSDLIALGRVVSTEPEGIKVKDITGTVLFTRHTFEVDAYFKGSGPEAISLLTHGGIEKVMVDGEERRSWTDYTGSEQVQKGDHILAFLRAVPAGWIFVEWDGAKYKVKKNSKNGKQTVSLRLRKKQYMRGMALQAFKKMEEEEQGRNPSAAVEAKLRGSKFLTEDVELGDLDQRLKEIIDGETTRRR